MNSNDAAPRSCNRGSIIERRRVRVGCCRILRQLALSTPVIYRLNGQRGRWTIC